MDPEKLDKYLYIRKTPTWWIRGFYFFGLISWLLIAYIFSGAIFIDPFFFLFVTPLMIFFTVYHIFTYGLCLFYRQFDLEKHTRLLDSFWLRPDEPTVDIFLPICGEEMKVLTHTWEHVSRLRYSNKRVYVLDDSKEECEEHREAAERYGFTYFARPNRGEMKKAGNLKYGYQRTSGEFITIFDADFAPHPDFLKELLPYFSDSNIGIVQSPQYFETTKAVHRRSALEYGAAQVQEAFYRFIQVARDRFGGTICCGSNAIYRRSALDEIGGTVQIEHSEDAHTGFALVDRGWVVRYVPIILAVGICPDNAHAYFHQQHRWCLGSMSLLSTKKFWTSPVSWKTKFCYMVGFFFYIHHPFTILFSFQLFWTLFFYNPYISFSNGLLYYPYLIWGFWYLFLFPIARFRRGCFEAMFLQLYAYSHAVLSALASSTVGWIPTNAKHATASVPFRQTAFVLGMYVFGSFLLIALAARGGLLHVFNYNYYSIQFWMFYNLIFSCLLLWQMYKTMERMQEAHVQKNGLAKATFQAWQLKTAGLYLLLLAGTFFAVLYL